MSEESQRAAMRDEIAREIVRVHEDSYGETATNVEVGLHESFVAVVMDIVLSRAEETLIDAGSADSVKQSREAFQLAIGPTFRAIVERATGRSVESFASRTMLDDQVPWSAEVFRMQASA